jgi:AbrB family looped-hinge helix DNA binding protein
MWQNLNGVSLTKTVRLSNKGQIIVPKNIRVSRAWRTGTEFTVQETRDGILLRPASRFPRTDLADVAGCLRFAHKIENGCTDACRHRSKRKTTS